MMKSIGEKMRQTIRSLTPELLLAFYRSARTKLRWLIFPIRNRFVAKKYKKLIIARFGELDTKSNIGTVIDIGANIGDFSHACRLLGFDVIAIEPHPDAVRNLRKRFKNDPKVRIFEFAISDSEEEGSLYFHQNHKLDPIHTSISATTISDKFKQNLFEVNVIQKKLLTILDGGTFALIKVDIEGSEFKLVDDLISSSPQIHRLLIEKHERFMSLSKDGPNYREKMSQLEDFIRRANLGDRWLLDWI